MAEMKVPTNWLPGESKDPIWEEILNAFNVEHQGKYGTPMNRPWGSDPDAQASYNALAAQYEEKWKAANPPTATTPPTVTTPPEEETGGGVGGNWNQYEGNIGALLGGFKSPIQDDVFQTKGKAAGFKFDEVGAGGDGDGNGDVVGGNWNQYEGNIGALLGGFRSPIQDDVLALAKEQISYTSRRLGEIEQARKLGDMTGTLTSSEIKMFDEMETSAVSNLKSQVNAQTQDVWNTALSDLVNRGVLQGTVGQKILGTISSENVRTVAEGTNTIRGTMNANRLNIMEGNKNRALTWQQMLTQESMGLLGQGQGYANADLQAELSKLGLGVNANLQMAGLASTEGMSEENRALQLALGQLQAQTAGAGFANQWNIANLQSGTQLKLGGMDAQTKLALAALYGNAANTSSLYGLGGNALTAGLGALSKTDWWQNLGKSSSNSNPYYNWGGNSPTDWSGGQNTNTGQWFWEEQ